MNNDLRILLNKQYPIEPTPEMNFDNRIIKTEPLTPLCELMNKYNSDKGGGNEYHNYTRLYHFLLHTKVNENLNIFELGLGSNNIKYQGHCITGNFGGCLKAWNEYLVNSNIYGCDIDEESVNKFSVTNKIKVFTTDSTDVNSINNMWNNINVDMDLIIDDAIHKFESSIIFFNNSIHKLKVGGKYIIQSVIPEDIETYKNYFNNYKNSLLNLKVNILELPNALNTYDNRVIFIERL